MSRPLPFMTHSRLARLALALACFVFCAIAQASDADDLVIVIRGEPVTGRPIPPATETEFRFKSAETGDVLTFRWADLMESDRKRVQLAYGVKIEGGRKLIGEKITLVRLTLDSGKTLEGLRIPEADTPTEIVIRTASSPRIRVPTANIKSEEKFEGVEGDVYSRAEIYEKWMVEKTPGQNDANAHLEMARKAAGLDLYDKALNHLTSAEIIDPRTKERNVEFRTELIAKHADFQARELYNRLLLDIRVPDYVSAMDKYDQLERNFPNQLIAADMVPRWRALLPEITSGLKVDQTKKVVQMSYRLSLDMIQQRMGQKTRLDEKGNKVASIPGKQVTTKQGHIFRGSLLDAPPDAELVIKVVDTTLKIKRKDIMSIQDVDLATFTKEVDPTFEELKEFVTDTGSPDGLKQKIIAKISELLRMKPSEVKTVFDTRLNMEASYDSGVLTRTKVYATLHDANYDKGSWLRDGAKPAPIVEGQANANTASSYFDRAANRWRDRRTGEFTNAPDEVENPDLTDDPEIWWKYQKSETRFAILRAFAGEKVFKIKDKVVQYRCPTCTGNQKIPVPAPGGNMMMQRCHTCRGIGLLVKFMYQ